MPSDVQVFVRFKEQCVFAGEELNCVITFKNVAEHTEPSTPGRGPFRHNKRNSINQLAAAQATAGNDRLALQNQLHNARSPSVGRNERPRVRNQTSYSMSTPSTPIPREPSPSNESSMPAQGPTQKHQRSVSIMSMASPVLSGASRDLSDGRGQSKSMGHRRSSTMTIPSRLYSTPHRDRAHSS